MEHKPEEFEIPGKLSIVKGKGDLPLLRIQTRLASAELYLYAAHLTSFIPSGQADLLWTSPLSPFERGKAIRGGIPVCFPWFGPHRSDKALGAHGFARIRDWTIDSTAELSDGRIRVVLALDSDAATRAQWPYDFSARYTVTVGLSLDIELAVTNTGAIPFSYEDCLHTYFAVSDVATTSVAGLDGVPFIDRARGDARDVTHGAIAPASETVAIHTRAPDVQSLVDPGRTIGIRKDGFAGTVVWNPWEKSASADTGSGWRHFLCVEAANCIDTPLTLLAGTSHASKVSYRVDAV